MIGNIMSKRIVIWSGGYDSTLCLWNELQKNKQVEAWSFVWTSIDPSKNLAEHNVREKFKKKVKKLGYIINHKIINLRHEDIIPEGYSVMQASMFVPLTVFLAPLDSTIVFGFHWKDDYWAFSERFNEVIKSQCSVMNKNVELEFPLRNYKKWEIIRDIKVLKLEKYVWTCEFPLHNMKPCGNCEPCINKKLALYENKIRNGNNKPMMKTVDIEVKEVSYCSVTKIEDEGTYV